MIDDVGGAASESARLCARLCAIRMDSDWTRSWHSFEPRRSNSVRRVLPCVRRGKWYVNLCIARTPPDGAVRRPATSSVQPTRRPRPRAEGTGVTPTADGRRVVLVASHVGIFRFRLEHFAFTYTQQGKCKKLRLVLKPTGNTGSVHPAHGGKTQVRARGTSHTFLDTTRATRLFHPDGPADELRWIATHRGYGVDCDASQRQLRDSAAACENKGFSSIGVRAQCCLTLTRCTLFPEITPRHTSSHVHQNARTGHRQRKREALATSVVQGDLELPRGTSRHSGALADLGRGAAVEANLAGAAPSILW